MAVIFHDLFCSESLRGIKTQKQTIKIRERERNDATAAGIIGVRRGVSKGVGDGRRLPDLRAGHP
jgi:hypothetical protein